MHGDVALHTAHVLCMKCRRFLNCIFVIYVYKSRFPQLVKHVKHFYAVCYETEESGSEMPKNSQLLDINTLNEYMGTSCGLGSILQ